MIVFEALEKAKRNVYFSIDELIMFRRTKHSDNLILYYSSSKGEYIVHRLQDSGELLYGSYCNNLRDAEKRFLERCD